MFGKVMFTQSVCGMVIKIEKIDWKKEMIWRELEMKLFNEESIRKNGGGLEEETWENEEDKQQ